MRITKSFDHMDFTDVGSDTDFGDLPSGDEIVLTVNFRKPDRDRVDHEHVLALMLEEQGVARSNMPDVNVGDERRFKLTLTDSGREIVQRSECVRMTDDRLFFLPVRGA